jgi:hypothetical protein
MSKRNAGRRGRPRRRAAKHTDGGEAAAASTATVQAPERAAGARPARAARREPAPRGIAHRDPGGVGERPQAPWHPWPFSEILILVGAIGTIVGFASHGGALLFASIGAVVLGTLEFTIREHLSGYRAHTALLAAVPTALLHGGIALGLYALGVRGEALVLVPIVVDVPVFWLLFRFLRGRFQDARRERVFALGQR